MTPAQIAASVQMPEPKYPGARIAGQPNRVYLDSELLAHATVVAAAAVAAERAELLRYAMALLADDRFAITFQTTGQYRGAILGAFKAKLDAGDAAIRARGAESAP